IGRVNQAKAGGPIAFTSQHNDPVARTFAMNADGTGIHQITFHNPSTSAVADDYGPAVSPDGRQVAIIYGEDGGGQCGTFSPIVRSLYLVNIDGTNFHRVFPQSLRTYNDPQNGFALRCLEPGREPSAYARRGSLPGGRTRGELPNRLPGTDHLHPEFRRIESADAVL